MWLGSGIAVAMIRPLAWETPYASGAALRKKKKDEDYFSIESQLKFS